MEPFAWRCPYCQHSTIISYLNYTEGSVVIDNKGKDGVVRLSSYSITCPNRECKEYSLNAFLFKARKNNAGGDRSWEPEPLLHWQLRPQSSARPFPEYIPTVIVEDYNEACAIRDLSPKASATLSRRCLQGMIRNFWNVKGKTLFNEIDAIKEKVEPAVFDAIDAVRKIGNIGAHMEKDIDLVIPVEPEEAQMLIELIELLMEEWYIARKTRDDRLASIKDLAAAKKPSAA